MGVITASKPCSVRFLQQDLAFTTTEHQRVLQLSPLSYNTSSSVIIEELLDLFPVESSKQKHIQLGTCFGKVSSNQIAWHLTHVRVNSSIVGSQTLVMESLRPTSFTNSSLIKQTPILRFKSASSRANVSLTSKL
jgi:hypothetical protein